VESLLARGADADLNEADAHVQRLADPVQADSGFAMGEIWLVRSQALLARARRDEAAYRDYRDRYRAMARAGLRGPHEVGRGDDMTAGGDSES
jgi:hypothetical protein